jgi:predicted MFS family arabinose efflux permease
MFKTGYFYHFLTASIFIGMGAYFWFLNPSALEIKGINPAWFGGILLIWGLFRGLNGYLMLSRKKKTDNEI